jgi:glutamyl/glutaminyl-tRNA synthetase
LELGVTHVIRGQDHAANTALHVALAEALGGRAPEFAHVGLVVGPDGRPLSKRHGPSTLADLREAGIPSEAVRMYLEELGLPRGNVHLDAARLRRLATEVIAAMPGSELAERVGVPAELAPALRGARDLTEARDFAHAILEPNPVRLEPAARPTLERFRELRERANGALDAEAARELVREVKAVGGDLCALRLALTGRERGPELWTVLAALPRDETLSRIDSALGRS